MAISGVIGEWTYDGEIASLRSQRRVEEHLIITSRLLYENAEIVMVNPLSPPILGDFL